MIREITIGLVLLFGLASNALAQSGPNGGPSGPTGSSGAANLSGALTAGHVVVGGPSSNQVQDSSALAPSYATLPVGLNVSRTAAFSNSTSGPATALGAYGNLFISGVCSDTPICFISNLIVGYDTVDASGASGGIDTFNFEDGVGNGAKGGRQVVNGTATIVGTPGNAANYVGGVFTAVASAPAFASGFSGLWSIDNYSQLKSGATGWSNITGIEQDMGSVVSYREFIGMLIDLLPEHTTAATLENVGYTIDKSSASTATITCAYCIGSYDGFGPISSAGSILAMQCHANDCSYIDAIGNGIHLNTGFTFAGNAFDSPGYAVDGSGNTTINTLKAGTLYSAAGTPLPTCNTGSKGTSTMVSDAASTPTYHGTYSSGGSIISPVFCNGSNWVYN